MTPRLSSTPTTSPLLAIILQGSLTANLNGVTITADGLAAFGTGLGGTVLAHVAGNPLQMVGFNYPFGAGQVSYFSMPLAVSSTSTFPEWETLKFSSCSRSWRMEILTATAHRPARASSIKRDLFSATQ
jgi:hypothetical protein